MALNPFADGINNASNFTVQNISNKTVRVMGINISPGNSYNLMNLEGVTETDIKVSLLKGVLKRKLSNNEITITSSDLDLTTKNYTQGNFLTTKTTSVNALSSNYSTNFSNNPTQTVNIMLCGDSQTVGGATVMNDETLAWRGVFWETIKNRRDYVKLMGEQLAGLQLLSGSNLPGNIKLGDWHMCATGGYTIQQINAAVSTSESTYGTADVYVFLGGENNIGNGESATTILSRIYTFCQNRIAANPNCIVLVLDLVPHGPPLSHIAFDAISNAVNSGLVSYLAPLNKNVKVVPAGSLLTKAHLNSTGNHPNFSGYQIIGRQAGEAVLRAIGVTGATNERRLSYRMSTAKLSLVDDITSTCAITDNGTIGPVGDVSFSCGITFIPTDLSQVYQRKIFSIGPVLAADKRSINLLYGPPYGGYGSAPSLQLYIGLNAYFVHNDSLKINKTHVLVVSINATKREMTIYCLREGSNPAFGPVTSCVSTYSAPGPYDFTTGTIQLGNATQRGAVGYSSNFWCAKNYVATIDDAEQMYWDGAIPKYATAYYPLNEGSGSTINPGSGFSGLLPTGTAGGTATWSAAGAVAQPWDRYQDS